MEIRIGRSWEGSYLSRSHEVMVAAATLSQTPYF